METYSVVGEGCFMGNPSAYLFKLTDSSFTIRGYWSNEYLEYNFEGNLLQRTITDTWLASHNAIRFEPPSSVVPVAQRSLCHSQKDFNVLESCNLDIQSIDPDFQVEIDKLGNDVFDGEEWICGDIKLIRWSGKNPLFLVINTKSPEHKIIAAKCFENHNFVDGDSGTHVYVLNKKNILIWNDGDTPSVLLYKFDTAYKLTPIAKEIIDNAVDIQRCFVRLRQAIVEFLFDLFPETEYTILNSTAGYNILPLHKVNPKFAATIDGANITLRYLVDGNLNQILSVYDKGLILRSKMQNETEIIIKMDNIGYEVVKKVREFVTNITESCSN
jgi:hypothetical protein